ncbi:MAG: tetratricopeptide repeat protein, partial [Proteobacteria bacterium]|nr:tetratricopeptide repeat protein [Pseudomonadota bacterium]
LVPENPEYAYYEGLAYQATDNLELERASYQRGLAHASDALPLLLNLGHNFLESGELDAALTQYEAVLTLNPQESAALYNKGLIYREKGQRNEEREAWKQYLTHHRSGKWAGRAVSHLNNLGDFSYRSYQLGNRRIVFSHQALLGESNSPDDRDREIRTLALLLLENPNLDLNIVTFQEKDSESAKSQAQELKNLLLAATGKKVQSRIRLSWFGEAETVTANTNPYHLTKGILIFANKEMGTTEEKQI